MFSYNLILSDISEEDRLGIDLTYEPEFESIESEIQKSTDIFATSKTDWKEVHNKSLNLISNKSKDYRYLYWILLSIQKGQLPIDPLHLVLIINDFISKYNIEIYPSRKKNLYSTINQIIQKLNDIVKPFIDNINDLISANDLIEILILLDNSINEIFNENTDNISSLINYVKSHKKRLKSVDSSKKEALNSLDYNKPIQIEPTKESTSISSSEITNDREANKALRHLQDVARSLSKYWLTERINNEKAYQLSRTLTWLTITQIPASNSNDVTMLKPVPQTRKQHFNQLKADSDHVGLLINLEESLSKSPFWLDGHFMAWESLIELNHHDAAQCIVDQVSLLIKKLPEITHLKFDDNSEFSTSTTRSWLEEHCYQEDNSKVTENINIIEKNTESEWDLALQNAQSLLNQKTLTEILQPLVIGHHQSRSNREAFFWQFSQAKLLSQAQKYDLASALLGWLDSQYSHKVLTHWDPSLEERLLELWLSCQQKLPSKEKNNQLTTTLRERLCCLNPMRVLN